ncbi:hypothetical protein EK21DRAFT_71367 [Setomelanomma holmii]|uniref:DUF6594 domain-containing protein n=1 Tax=Setomelanomma holmii TaxID=210430 RepID=A0A9P4H4T2_9PLEO|nr:hypothetical protein EK21DRAFT_71367 [Setomelanomma holmii]
MDIEKVAGEPKYLSGFPSLAAFIATDRDKTTAIFKRFKRLGARHLLHLQCQLAKLQTGLDAFDREEALSDLNTKQYSRNWKLFCEGAEHDPRQKKKKELLDKIGQTLADYRKALLYESKLASLPPPSKRTLQAFRYHFFNQDSGSPYPTLGASSDNLFDDEDDLVALRAEDRDRLTAFLQDHCSWLFKTGRPRGNIVYASDRHVARFVTILSTINAAALLVGAIVSLYAIDSPRRKLGIIALFTALFAANVGILTNARRTELFAATAAYVQPSRTMSKLI